MPGQWKIPRRHGPTQRTIPRINLPFLPAALGIITLIAAATADAPPLLKVLDKFTAPKVPAMGPGEKPAPLKPVPVPPAMPAWPGKGLAQHPFLYGGEGYNTITLFKGGKSIWTYQTGPGWEIDDCWMLSNGNILYSRMQIRGEKGVRRQIMVRPETETEKGEKGGQATNHDRMLQFWRGFES